MQVRINVIMELEGSEMMNTWYADTVTFPDAAAVQSFVTNIYEPVIDQVSEDIDFIRVDVRREDIAGQLTVPFTPTGWPKNGEGTVGAGALPGFAAVLIKGFSTDGVPPGRIRKFIPGVTEADHDNGTLTTAAVTAWNGIVSAWQTWIDTDPEMRPIAVTRAGVPPVVTAFNDIETFSLNTTLAIMSTRKKGRGS